MTNQWIADISPVEWDSSIAETSAHPLQSALWNHARSSIEQISGQRYTYFAGKKPICLARIETRIKPGIGKTAWIPKGPVVTTKKAAEIFSELFRVLKKEGYKLAVIHEYRPLPEYIEKGFKTIWIDLTLGADTLYNRLDKQWRYGVNRARREGVEIKTLNDDSFVQSFFKLCKQLSQQKTFDLPGSLAFIQYLVNHTFHEKVSFTLFSAIYHNQYIAGAVVARCGRNIHYFWGASDRKHSKQRPSEAIQWAIIEWALENACVRYDLEGIDPINNPGVYAFKKKMGGQEVYLPRVNYTALSLSGRVAINMGKMFNKLV